MGWIRPLQHEPPAFNYGQEGRYLLKFGLFSSTGNPTLTSTLPTTWPVLKSFLTIALTSRSWMCIRATTHQSSQFYYGTDNVVSTFENLGNMSVENITVSYSVYNTQYDPEVEDSCEIPVMHPSDTATCTFNLTTTGNNRLIRVQMPTIYRTAKTFVWATTSTRSTPMSK